MPSAFRSFVMRSLPLLAIALLAGCTIAKPRTDDPYEKMNRKVYAFNNSLDKAIIRPVAVGYRKVTNPTIRRCMTDFFTNIRMPITVANDLLQARPKQALQGSGRFLVNLTLGIGGFFDPASQLGIPLDDTDFGVTLARWGVPDGPYLMVPFFGPSTARDFWQVPVDGYFFDPISYFERNNHYEYGQQYLPELMYLVTIRASAIDAESFLSSAYDPYAFIRDAYRQQRIYKIYDGNPPEEVIEQLQGLHDKSFDPDELLDEQQKWEKKQPQASQDQPEPKKD
ncbi:MlaA family lipoprotein [Dyella japonica]